MTPSSSQRSSVFIASATIGAMAFVLSMMGRRFWCQCGHPVPWSWDVWTEHNSQHLIDAYFFTHVLHGVLFAGILSWGTSSRLTRPARRWAFSIAIAIEAAWEILENSPRVIDRYREATMALGYTGDSIANSITDVLACGLGFWLANRLGWRWSLALFVAVELVLLGTIRDCLVLNIVMLTWPIEAIQDWQMSGR